MDLCFQSLVKSLLFFFSVFSFSFFPPWKDSLTNYDSWVEGLSLFTLQRQTCESRGGRYVINVSTVHLIFSLHECESATFWRCWPDLLAKFTHDQIIKYVKLKISMIFCFQESFKSSFMRWADMSHLSVFAWLWFHFSLLKFGFQGYYIISCCVLCLFTSWDHVGNESSFFNLRDLHL